MGERVTLDAAWRDGNPFVIYRNPDSKDRREMVKASERRGFRFILSGRGDLFVGDAWDFTHHDSHTKLTGLYESNEVWSGEVIFAGPKFPISFGGVLCPTVEYDDPRNSYGARPLDISRPHTAAEFAQDGTICLARMSNYRYRERGLLDQSTVWRRFSQGSQRLPVIAPLVGLTANEAIDPTQRGLLLLHTDGHLYWFSPETSIADAADQINQAERSLYPRQIGASSDAIIGLRLGGNGNAEIEFSDASRPLDFLLDNRNFCNCFGDNVPEIIDERHVADAKRGVIPREDLPAWR